MKGIKANVILCKNIQENDGIVSINKILRKAQSLRRENFWMYLDIQTTLEFPNETPIYFALMPLMTKSIDYIEMGNTILYKSVDTPNTETITKFKYRTTMIQKFSNIPILRHSEYEFVVYILDDNTSERTILDTFKFEVV